MEFGQDHHLETSQVSGVEAYFVRAYMDKIHRPLLFQEDLLLFPKNYNSKNPRELPDPWADRAYRLT